MMQQITTIYALIDGQKINVPLEIAARRLGYEPQSLRNKLSRLRAFRAKLGLPSAEVDFMTLWEKSPGYKVKQMLDGNAPVKEKRVYEKRDTRDPYVIMTESKLKTEYSAEIIRRLQASGQPIPQVGVPFKIDMSDFVFSDGTPYTDGMFTPKRKKPK